MIRSVTFIIFLMGATIIRTYANEPSIEEKQNILGLRPPGSSKEDYSDASTNENELNPAMTCVLFGHIGCHIQCLLILESYYFNFNTYGMCNDHRWCVCNIHVVKSFYFNWSMKFDAEYVYDTIAQDEELFTEVSHLFEFPIRTAKEYKKILKPMLTPYLYYKLNIRDNSFAALFTADDGTIKEELVTRYVYGKLQNIYESDDRRILFSINYRENLRQALEGNRNPSSIYNIAYGIRQLKNDELWDTLRNYLSERNINVPNIQLIETETLTHTLTRILIKNLIEKTTLSG